MLWEGLEPSRPCGQRILSPLCLPIPPPKLRVDTQGIEPWTCRLWVGCSDRWAKCPVIFFLSPGRNLISCVAGLSCWRGERRKERCSLQPKSTTISINLPCIPLDFATSPSLHDRLRLSSLVTVPSRVIYYYIIIVHHELLYKEKLADNFAYLFAWLPASQKSRINSLLTPRDQMKRLLTGRERRREGGRAYTPQWNICNIVKQFVSVSIAQSYGSSYLLRGRNICSKLCFTRTRLQLCPVLGFRGV